MSGSAFRRQVDVFVARSLAPEARSRILAETARKGVAELVRSGRAPPDYRRYVDGVPEAPEHAVRPEGVIVYRFHHMAEVVAFALAYLRQRAPRSAASNGNYDRQAFVDSFYLGLDGRFVPAGRFAPARMGPVSEVVIGNTRPYNRLVDVQMRGGQRVRFSVPADIYRDCYAQIDRRFGNHVTTRRVASMTFPGQYVLRRGRRAGRRVESPALVITAR